MAHSIFFMVFAALLAAATLWGEHYQPWGKKLDARLNYVLGTLAMQVPFCMLMVAWVFLPPPGLLAVWAIVGQAFIATVSGLLVHVLYEVDAKRHLHQRAKAAEAAEKAARSEPA